MRNRIPQGETAELLDGAVRLSFLYCADDVRQVDLSEGGANFGLPVLPR
jgi:hypothetical protein